VNLIGVFYICDYLIFEIVAFFADYAAAERFRRFIRFPGKFYLIAESLYIVSVYIIPQKIDFGHTSLPS
jgi:hypothetical protein